MLTVKCGRNEINLSEKDLISFNGAVYCIRTQKIWQTQNDWKPSCPNIAKGRAEKLIKQGKLIYSHSKESLGMEIKYYKVNAEQL